MTCLFLILLAWLGAAQAHQPGVSYGEVRHDSLTVIVDVDEFADRFPTSDIDAASLLLIEHTIAATGVTVDGHGCMIGNAKVEPYEEDAVRIYAPVYCEQEAGTWTYHASWLRGREAGHRHIVTAFGEPVGVLGPEKSSIDFEPGELPSKPAVVAQFVWLGIEHILGGYDHLAFVLGLLLVFRTWREAGMVVTGFTVAHSVTLSASALGLVQLSPSVVEPLIALSVAWVGLENLVDPPAWRRLILTFGMGLIHGFGFAGALGEVGLPRDAALLSLVGFNVGVEIGQFAIVLILLPAFLRIRDREWWENKGIPGFSLGIAALGLTWFFVRVLGS